MIFISDLFADRVNKVSFSKMSDIESTEDFFMDVGEQSQSSTEGCETGFLRKTFFLRTKSSDEEDEVQPQVFEPYQEEPLAQAEQVEKENMEADLDGLTPETLAKREEGVIAAEEW